MGYSSQTHSPTSLIYKVFVPVVPGVLILIRVVCFCEVVLPLDIVLFSFLEAHPNLQFPTPGVFLSGTFGDFFAAIDTWHIPC